MRYKNIYKGKFIERPNRFIALVELDDTPGIVEKVHVKNTGRCKELLLPGCEIYLEKSDNPNRKTQYDLVTVRKDTGTLFNIDSQTPNKITYEWLKTQDFSHIKPEFTYGNSRLDFYLEKNIAGNGINEKSKKSNLKKYLIEVKGCTLEIDGIGYFPDAPTERGVKHLRELTKAATDGFKCSVVFVVQMDGVREVLPNEKTHPEFKTALEEARAAGVNIILLLCKVTPYEVSISEVLYQH